MFFRKDNYISIDFVEEGKPTRDGVVKEFNTEGVVVKFDNDMLVTFVPFTAISEVRLIESKGETIPKTQF